MNDFNLKNFLLLYNKFIAEYNLNHNIYDDKSSESVVNEFQESLQYEEFMRNR